MRRGIKRLLIPAVAACAVVGVTQAPALADGPTGTFGTRDTIVASVINNPNRSGPLASFNMLASSGAHGESPQGSFVIGSFGFNAYGASVTCVSVSGGLATVVGRVSWSILSPRQVGTYTRVRLEDTGFLQDSTDKIQFGPYTGDPKACPDPVTPMRDPITLGLVAINDAP